MPSRRQLVGVILGFLAGGLVVLVLFLTLGKNNNPIPASISKQLKAPALLPVVNPKSSGFQINKASFKYDATDNVLSYVVNTSPPAIKVTITEQPTPSEFIDIADSYTKLVNSFNPFLTFDTPAGTVSVGYPTQLHGNQAAVLNGEGDLLFAHPDHSLSETQWRQLFNSLSIVH